MTYRTKDGHADYCFNFEEQSDGIWRAYIVTQPTYRGLPDGPHETHRLTADDGRHYVCWTEPLQNLGEAQRVAEHWADETQAYVKGLPAFQEHET